MDQRYDPAFQRGHAEERSRPVAVQNGSRSRLASLDEVAPQLIRPPDGELPERPPRDDRFDDGPRARVQPYRPGSAAPDEHATRDRGADGYTAADHTVSDRTVSDRTVSDDAVSDHTESDEARHAHRTRAAVWERTLWAIGVILAAGGGLGMWQSYTLMFRGFVGDSGPTDNYLWMQFLGAISPSLIVVGLATIVGLLFRRMLDHDRRSRP